MRARSWLLGSGVALAAAALGALVYVGHEADLAANRVAATERAAGPVTGEPPPDAVQRVLALGKPVVAEFGANVCAACREMKPVLAQLAREHGDRLEVVDVDLIADRRAGYLQRYRIQLMPTQIFYDAQGREIGRHMGTMGADAILARLGLAQAETAHPSEGEADVVPQTGAADADAADFPTADLEAANADAAERQP